MTTERRSTTTSSGRPRHVPRLRFRPTTHRDFPECFELLPAWLSLEEHVRRALPELWMRLLDEPAIRTTVMEDLALPAGERIQGWGWGIVLPESWVEQHALRTKPRAHVVRQIYAGFHDGSLALLSDAQIGMLNASGRFHFLNCYAQRHNDLSDAYTQSVLTIANEAFRLSASGYNFEAMYFETSERDVAAIAAAGFLHRRYADASSLDGLAPAERPAFLAVTRAEALASLPGTSARHVFEHHPPMFRFSAAQRRLLWLALFDDSDANLSDRLDVSVHGLKKLWRGIYDRIEDRMSGFFGDTAGDEAGKRGPEKRRQVLAYVRQRPEELRPWA